MVNLKMPSYPVEDKDRRELRRKSVLSAGLKLWSFAAYALHASGKLK
jgi:hypothetical protein